METILRDTALPVDSIKPNPLNPRKRIDDEKLQELAESIKQVGILQPLIVAEDYAEPGTYNLIAGERRLKAAKIAGLEHVPVIYRHDIIDSTETQVVAMLIENLQREDLDPIEEARAFQSLTRDHGYKQTELAERIGVSQSHIANRIRLLILPESAQEAISAGKLTASVGKELATLAKVPATRDAITEALASDEDNDDLLWAAKRHARNATKPLHEQGYPEPVFDFKGCQGCEHRVMLPEQGYGAGGKLMPRCMNVACWDEKQEAAEAEAAERARQQVLNTGDEVLRLSDLPGGANSYEYLGEGYGIKFDQTDCTQCEHKRLGKTKWANEDDEPDDVCINPACFKAKQAEAAAELRRREKELKAAHGERKEQLIAAFYPDGLLNDPDPDDCQALVYIAAQAVDDPPYSSSMSKAKVKAAVYERYGWELPEGLSWSDEDRHLVSQLETLPVSELLRLIFFAMLRPVDHDNGIFRAVYEPAEAEDEAEEDVDGDDWVE